MAPNWAIAATNAGSRMTAARVTCGAICLSSSSHLPANPPGNVAAWPRQAIDEARADRIGHAREHDRQGAGDMLQCCHACCAGGKEDVRCERDQFLCVSVRAVGVGLAPANIDARVVADSPSRFL